MRRKWKLFFHFIVFFFVFLSFFLYMCKSERFNIIYRVTVHGSCNNSNSNISGSVLTLYNYNKTCYERKKILCFSLFFFCCCCLSISFYTFNTSLRVHAAFTVRFFFSSFESLLGCESFLWFILLWTKHTYPLCLPIATALFGFYFFRVLFLFFLLSFSSIPANSFV